MTTIRAMTIADYDSVHALWLCIEGMGINDIDDSFEGIRRYLARNPGTSFVALDGARVVGAILAGHDGRRGFLTMGPSCPNTESRASAGFLQRLRWRH